MKKGGDTIQSNIGYFFEAQGTLYESKAKDLKKFLNVVEKVKEIDDNAIFYICYDVQNEKTELERMF